MASLIVPFTGSNVVAQGEGPSRDSAPVQRKSLHTVQMPRQTVESEYEPQWNDKGQVKWVAVQPPEPEPEPIAEDTSHSNGNGLPGGQQGQSYDALAQQIQSLTQTVQMMAQGQMGGAPVQPQGPQPPDPTQFDFYEARDVAEFQKQNNAYIQAMVQHSVQTALDPHRDAMQSAEYSRQYNSVLADHSNDPNFKPLMDTALQMVAKSNGKFTIPEAYEWVASSQITSPQQQVAQPAQQQVNAKPAQRTLSAQEAAQKRDQAQSLPPRNGVSGAGDPALPASLMNVGALGRIMLHNQQTGRARPI